MSFAVFEAPLFSLLVQGETDEGLLKESVESLVDLVKSAQGLVRRIEDAVDKYLFWDEEVQVYEAVNAVRMGRQEARHAHSATTMPICTAFAIPTCYCVTVHSVL